MRPAVHILTGALSMIARAAMATSSMLHVPMLTAARGHERVLILFAPAAGDARLAAQDRLLAPAGEGLRERDLRVARVVGDAVTGVGDEAALLRGRFGVTPSAFALRLIGKDGHVAMTRTMPMTPADLFRTIDAMPRRQDEMRRRR